jgi:hypothetical protein
VSVLIPSDDAPLGIPGDTSIDLFLTEGPATGDLLDPFAEVGRVEGVPELLKGGELVETRLVEVLTCKRREIERLVDLRGIVQQNLSEYDQFDRRCVPSRRRRTTRLTL